jgi:hypothetical protein
MAKEPLLLFLIISDVVDINHRNMKPLLIKS